MGDPFGGERLQIQPQCNSILRRIWTDYVTNLYKDPKSVGDETSIKRTLTELEILGADIGFNLWIFIKKNASEEEHRYLSVLSEQRK